MGENTSSSSERSAYGASARSIRISTEQVEQGGQPQNEYMSLHQLFEQRVALSPDAIALVLGEQYLSYEELNRRANRLAHSLRATGFGPEQRAGIYMQRSPQMVLAILAILKAGGAYVPMDVSLPGQRLLYQARDARLALLLTQERLLANVQDMQMPLVCLDGFWEETLEGTEENLHCQVQSENLIYVIYTSGSTGQPKGVMCTQRGLWNHFRWMLETFALGPDERVLQRTSVGFDAAGLEIFWPLLSGATLVLADPDAQRDSAALVRTMIEQQITHAQYVPALLRALLEEPEVRRCTHLRQLLCGGESLPSSLQELFFAHLDATFYNLYGPTEASINATYWQGSAPGEDEASNRIVPIGQPIAHTQVSVLDRWMFPALPGESGELYIGGAGLARGYLGQPALTAERFVPDPYGTRAGSRLYKTGDMVRARPDGALEYLGRLDYQVKMRGFRVELGEIEQALLEQAALREAVVVARENDYGVKQLVAYVVPDQPQTGKRDWLADVSATLRQRLPEYMLPAHLIPLDALPLLANGKVDRQALPQPVQLLRAAEALVAPRTPVEHTLVRIWSQILHLPQISLEDDFFALGGDSITALALVGQARKAGLTFSVNQLFQNPTIAQLGQVAVATQAPASTSEKQQGISAERSPTTRSARSEQRKLSSPHAVPEDFPLLQLSQGKLDRLLEQLAGSLPDPALLSACPEDIYPLSGMQAALLFHNQEAPERGVYISHVSLQLEGSLHLPAFLQSWRQLLAAYTILRTSFVNADIQAQVVWKSAPLPLALIDGTQLASDEQMCLVDTYRRTEGQRGFVLHQAPLFRVALFRFGEQRFHLLWSVHHAILDGWSTANLLKELFQRYEALVQARDLALPANRPYRDYIAWLLQQNQPAAEQFWREHLGNLAAPTLLPLLRRSVLHSAAAPTGYQQLDATFSREFTRQLHTVTRDLRITTSALLQASWAFVLSRYCGQAEVLIGMVVAGRDADLDGIEALAGLCINALPMRIALTGQASIKDWLRSVHAQQALVQSYGYYPAWQIQRASGLEPGQPLFQNIFVVENYPVAQVIEQARRCGLQARLADTEYRANYPLVAMVLPGEQLRLLLIYQEGLLEPELVARMLQYWRLVLETIVAQPEQRVDSLPQWRAEERELLAQWNATERVYAQHSCLHHAFEQRVAQSPDAIALTQGEHQLSYAALNSRANRLARQLQSQGVGLESRVGVCMERNLEMVLALLAILKAGGVYVPLDTALPGERLLYQARDAQITLVLAQERQMESARATQVPLLCLEHCLEQPPAHEEEENNPQSLVQSDNLAYITYTSGSSGQPKGVMNTQRGLWNYFSWMLADYPLAGGDRLLQVASMSFDASIWEMCYALASGSTLVLLPTQTQRDSTTLARVMVEQHITCALFVPSLLRVLLEEPDTRHFTHLRRVFCTGETLPPTLPLRFFAHSSATLHNLYGPTETAFNVTILDLERQDAGYPARTVALGAPLPNVRIYLFDQQMLPVPIGAVGELSIGGDALGRGYVNRPGLTAERFVPDPLSGADGKRLYRTGDLARYRSDGKLEFIERIDAQVKVRGVRIELGEIEQVLLEDPTVRNAVVVVYEDRGDAEQPAMRVQQSGTGQLAAYVVYNLAQEPEPGWLAEVRAHLRRRLPEYMLPSSITRLDALPLTHSGKVDRQALPRPTAFLAATVAASEARTPLTPVEQLLAGIWQELLGVPVVSTGAHFFALGGHSLVAMQVTARLRQHLGIELPLRTLFETPLLADLAWHVEQALAGATSSTDVPLLPFPRTQPVPLSFAQQRLWFLDQLERDQPTYNAPITLHLSGDLKLKALLASLDQMEARHEVLRLRVEECDGQALQESLPFDCVPLRLIDLSALLPQQREAERQRITHQETHTPFDLRQGPLWRACLLRLEDQAWLLLLTLHHIIIDGWSIALVLRELGAGYTAYSQGSAPVLPALPVQYADYTLWQRASLQGARLQDQLEYWRAQLAELEPLNLPTDYPRPTQPGYHGAQESLYFSPELSEQVQAFSRQEGLTPFMTLLAAWLVVLQRYSGQHDLSIGTPIAARTRAELEDLLGFFVNTLILRCHLDDEARVRDLLRRVREVTLQAYSHQELPFEQLVETLQPERDPGHHPLFQVMFDLARKLPTLLTWDELEVRREEALLEVAKFDLSLTVSEEESGLLASLNYNTSLFAAPTIRRMLEHWQRMLLAILEQPEQRVADLSFLSEEESERMLVAWNATERPYDQTLCVHQLFEAQVEQTPDAIAVVQGEIQFTSAELNRRANQLAHYLRQQGISPEARVGICIERSPEMVVAILAVLKAGGCYVPLDTDLPQQRLHYQVQDAQVALILTQQRMDTIFASFTVPLFYLDRAWPELASEETSANLHSQVQPDNLFCIIYTSGSTGQPKGVMDIQRGLANHFQWSRRAFPLSPADNMLQISSVSFDNSLNEIFRPLLAGARLTLAQAGEQRDSAYLLRLIAEQEITMLECVPALLHVLLEEAEPRQCMSITQVLCGGEMFPSTLQRLFFSRVQAELHNAYGPTEASIDITTWRCAAGDTEMPVPLGRPIDNTRIYLLGRSMQPVPIGVAGELYAGGDALGRGYFAQPALTAERFVPDPFSRVGGERLYRTGDLARYRSDGTLEFLGRVDHQVKIRGFRIELGEIEQALLAHATVREAVVVAREEQNSTRQLLAYVVPVQSQDPAPEWIEAVRADLRQRLPDYMLPAHLVALAALPLTHSGKVDRRALPDPPTFLANTERQSGTLAALSPTEQLLASIWQELLQVPVVSADEHFFALGGHSLVVMRVMARIRQHFGVTLPVRALFEAPTLARLAQRVAQALTATPSVERPALRPVEREHPLPLSFAQERLWFLDQLASAQSTYNVPLLLRLRGPLQPALLAASLRALEARQENLRLHIEERDGQAFQHWLPVGSVGMSVVDLSALDPAQRELEQAQWTRQQAHQPFDLRLGPLWRVCLLRLELEEWLCLLTMHHIIMDEWSDPILLRELGHCYRALAGGKPLTWPAPLPVQYADYACWQRTWLCGAYLERELDYWRQQLANLAPLALPTDHPRPKDLGTQGACIYLRVSSDLTERVRQLSRQEGVTPFMTLLAAWLVVLARYSGQTDVAVGTPIANRQQAELEEVIGFFLNTLVLRCSIEGTLSVKALLARVREVALQAYSHQDVPFEQVVEAVTSERDLSRHPLFQVMFVLQTQEQASTQWGDVAVQPEDTELDVARFDLLLAVGEDQQGQLAHLEYNTELFEPETIQRMLGHWQNVLEAMLEQPEQRLENISLLDEEERLRQLVQWNATERVYPQQCCVQQLFEQQAEQTPDAIALVLGEQYLSYEELNRHANQLAHELRAEGVGPEVRVGICMGRSLGMVLSVLGILKAGGAFVLCDPAYPRERLAFMLADARPQLLLTHTALLAHLPEHTPSVICLDQLETSLSQQPSHNPAPTSGLLNLFCVIYTSGSTGQPKGIAQSHKTLSNLLAWQVEHFAAPTQARTLQYASPSFDVCYQEMFATWATGGTLLLVDEELRRDPEALISDLNTYAVERLFLPFVALQQLAECAGKLALDLSFVREIITAGEQLHLDKAIRRLLARQNDLRGCVLHNQYGPAECHVVLEYAVRETDADLPPIGRPLANTQVYLLDAQMQAVPIGVTGELYIGGIQLARGYLNRPAMTAERFGPDPFASTGERRLYRTGDLARYLSDGTLEFLGRRDEQVKIRGYRVEVGEIEAALAEYPAVQACAVAARADAAAGKYLVAYLVPRVAHELSIDQVQEYLRARLPAYMLPARFVQLEALPLTPNHKVDRRALPAPEMDEGHAERGGDTQYGPVEEILAGIWEDILGVKRPARAENFFALGGHSLVVMRVMARIRQHFGVTLPMRALFEAPTLAQLAQRVAQALTATPSVELPALQPVERERPLPLSFAQERLWFLDQLASGQPTYNVPLLLRLRGPLQPALLAASLRALEARQENLRLRIEERDGQAFQHWLPVGSLGMSVVDLSALEPAQRGQEQAHWTRQQAHQPFDLRLRPLWRVCLLCLEPEEWLLLLTMHHIIMDEWSAPILLRELGYCYRALAAGKPLTWPAPLPVQYADYACWQRAWLCGTHLERELDYWRQQLAHLAPLALPVDHPRPRSLGTRGACRYLRVSSDLTERVRQLSQQEGVTPFMTLLAAWLVVLARYSGQTDVAVGTPIANRQQAELEELIGFFLNTLVLRCSLEGTLSVKALLARVREVALQAYSHQDVPFEQVVEAVASERDLSRHPLFQVMFVLLAQEQALEPWDMLRLQQEESELEVARFELTLAVREDAQGLLAGLEYNTELFEPETIERMLGHWQNVLEAMLAQPEQRLENISLLAEEEQLRQLVHWNATERVYPQSCCVQQFFEQQVAQTPDTIALVLGEQHLSYAELNRRANHLAHDLQTRGIGPEKRVGICVERSVEMVLAILAVLKTGGAYVPMDVALPSPRLLYQARDARIALLLTQQRLAETLQAEQVPLLCLDSYWDQPLSADTEHNLSCQVAPDNLIYVIYTSGSTGQPKGVMNTQRGLWNHFCWMLDACSLHPEDRTLQVASVGFDASVWEIFCPLLSGGRLVLLTPGTQRDSLALLQIMIEQQITSVLWVPSLLQALLEEPSIKQCTALRQIFCGGEAFPTALQKQCLASLPVALYNLYGPSEAAIVATAWDCQWADGPAEASAKFVPLGFPLANVQVYLLDRALAPVPVGVSGEMYLGGVGLARGYMHRPELTAEHFIPHPFSQTGGERLYKTGDLARYRVDGVIEFVERADYQVKVRGFRIELGEIEQTLLAHADVHEAAVVAPPNESGVQQLLAYIVAVQAQQPTPTWLASIRAHLRQRLPEYMLPTRIITVEALPLTHSGKIDRRALQARGDDQAQHEIITEEQQPQNAVERQLLSIWQALLQHEQISLNADFFRQGGHSLSALRLLARIEKAFKQRIPVSQFFQGPTIRELARLLAPGAAQLSSTARLPSALVPLQPHGTHTPFFCIHPGAGTVFCYLSLAQQLGTNYPVYGLQFPEADERPAQVTVEQLATHYIAAIQTVQSHGPYCLGGWSAGGLIAFEMACQLRRQGQEVALLCLLDTRVPAYFKNERGLRPYTLEEYMAERGIASAEIARMTDTEKLHFMYEVHQRDGLLPDGLDLAYVQAFLASLLEIIVAASNYKAARFDRDIALLRITPEAELAEETAQKGDDVPKGDLTYGWQEKTSGAVEVQQFPGSHEHFIYEPYVQAVATALRSLLDRVDQVEEDRP